MSAAINIVRLQGTRIPLSPEVICGLSFQITLDSSEQQVERKYAALRKAVELVSQRVANAFHGVPQFPVLFGAVGPSATCAGALGGVTLTDPMNTFEMAALF
jgi:hypothetical protein